MSGPENEEELRDNLGKLKTNDHLSAPIEIGLSSLKALKKSEGAEYVFIFEGIITTLDNHRSHLNCIGLPESIPDKNKKCINLYLKLFTSLNSYILEATNQELSKIEHVLMKTILMPDDWSKFWSTSLVSDLWYSLARCGPPALCSEHVEALLWHCVRQPELHRPQLEALIDRLTSSRMHLADGFYEAITSKFDPTRDERLVHAWAALNVRRCCDDMLRPVLEVCTQSMQSLALGHVTASSVWIQMSSLKVLAHVVEFQPVHGKQVWTQLERFLVRVRDSPNSPPDLSACPAAARFWKNALELCVCCALAANDEGVLARQILTLLREAWMKFKQPLLCQYIVEYLWQCASQLRDSMDCVFPLLSQVLDVAVTEDLRSLALKTCLHFFMQDRLRGSELLSHFGRNHRSAVIDFIMANDESLKAKNSN